MILYSGSKYVCSKSCRSLICQLLIILPIVITQPAYAAVGYADVVLNYFDSGAGPISGPYGGTYPTGPGFPISVSTSVVVGPEPGLTGFPDFLSLPTGSFVIVGFTDETVINGPGNDLFIQEIGSSGERADVFVSADGANFTFLGTAIDDTTTAFDLASINFLSPVIAVKIVGLDAFGGSPGFDVMNIQVLPGSTGPALVVPEPESCLLMTCGLAVISLLKRKYIKHANKGVMQ